MKKFTLLSLVAATVLFTACGEDAKKAVTDAATAATETVKETAAHAVDATKDVASHAVEATKEAAHDAVDATKEAAAATADAAKEKAASAAAALKERAAAATEAAKETAGNAVASAKDAVTPDNAVGQAAYAKCVACHGATGTTKALGKSAVIAGQSAAELEAALVGYKAGTRNVAGMGMLMKGQVSSMDEATIKAVSEYISGL
jgi:cytochrome c553